jgi:hypothetical protein
MDVSSKLSAQLEWMQLRLDPESGAILFRHPTLRGIPDLVVEGDGYTLEFIGPTLLCLDIQDPSGMARLLWPSPLRASCRSGSEGSAKERDVPAQGRQEASEAPVAGPGGGADAPR